MKRLLFTLLPALVIACGARPDLDVYGAGGSGGGATSTSASTTASTTATAGSGTGGGTTSSSTGTGGVNPGTCPAVAAFTTDPGPCAAQGQECGSGCGQCPAQETCFGGRCYHPAGLPASFPPPLLRGLYENPEGTRCVVAQGGALERVEAALWDAGADSVTMDVYVSCDGEMVKAASVTLPGSAFPLYDGLSSDWVTTTFGLDPPIAVAPGDTVAAMFHADGDIGGPYAAVSGIYMSDIDPACAFSDKDTFDEPVNDDPWEYMALLHIH